MKHYDDKAYLISYPKSGRTWVRVIMANLLKLHGGDPTRCECVRYRHDGFESHILRVPWYKSKRNPDMWKGLNVVELRRDPRDVIVSYYFQMVKREKKFEISLSDFIKDSKWGIRQHIHFLNQWQTFHAYLKMITIRYEEMLEDCLGVMEKVLKFWGFKCDAHWLSRAIELSTFQNMREIEEQDKERLLLSNVGALRCLDKNDPEAFKTRRGEAGAWTEYITEQKDLEFISESMNMLQDGYYKNDENRGLASCSNNC